MTTHDPKGRIDGADTVMITRQEVITSLHEPDKFILAVVQVENGFATAPRYVRGALDTREPPFEHSTDRSRPLPCRPQVPQLPLCTDQANNLPLPQLARVPLRLHSCPPGSMGQ